MHVLCIIFFCAWALHNIELCNLFLYVLYVYIFCFNFTARSVYGEISNCNCGPILWHSHVTDWGSSMHVLIFSVRLFVLFFIYYNFYFIFVFISYWDLIYFYRFPSMCVIFNYFIFFITWYICTHENYLLSNSISLYLIDI